MTSTSNINPDGQPNLSGAVDQTIVQNSENVIDSPKRGLFSWESPQLLSLSFAAKGPIIFLQILSLSFLAALAIGGTLSQSVTQFVQNIDNSVDQILDKSKQEIATGCGDFEISEIVWPSNSTGNVNRGDQILNCYQNKKYPNLSKERKPPTGILLDILQVNASWRTGFLLQDHKHQLTVADFHALFDQVDSQLLAIADSPLQDNILISNTFLPFHFRGENFKDNESISLPHTIKRWVVQQQSVPDRLRAIDTFFLVITLGTLGSVVSLLSQHIKDPSKYHFREYFWRPVFGILLAVAIYVIAGGLTRAVSTSSSAEADSTLELNRPVLVLLALAAGLLSEQAYASILDLSNDALTRIKDNTRTESDG